MGFSQGVSELVEVALGARLPHGRPSQPGVAGYELEDLAELLRQVKETLVVWRPSSCSRWRDGRARSRRSIGNYQHIGTSTFSFYSTLGQALQAAPGWAYEVDMKFYRLYHHGACCHGSVCICSLQSYLVEKGVQQYNCNLCTNSPHTGDCSGCTCTPFHSHSSTHVLKKEYKCSRCSRLCAASWCRGCSCTPMPSPLGMALGPPEVASRRVSRKSVSIGYISSRCDGAR